MKVFAKEAHFFERHVSLDALFARYGMQCTESIGEADLVLGQTRRRLSAYTLRYPTKAFALIADDPRTERTPAAFFRGPLGKKVHLLNVFSGEFYWDNYAFTNMLGVGEGPLETDIQPAFFEASEKERMLCCVLAYSDPVYGPPAPPTGYNLHRLRRDLVEVFFDEGLAVVSGRDWPARFGAAEDDFQSVGYDWSDRKLAKMTRYWFALSIENTLHPYYVTEKIWQAVVAGSLPLYYGAGGSTIYEDFPRDSFIDVAEFTSTKSLLSYLQMMTPVEAAQRMRLCRIAYNTMLERKPPSNDAYWEIAIDNVCRRLRELVEK